MFSSFDLYSKKYYEKALILHVYNKSIYLTKKTTIFTFLLGLSATLIFHALCMIHDNRRVNE
ncbi:hypothetical protein COB28_00345 [Candidatus Dependentiae bacterium]|nr:MAG: hypothetical protein COB28_00345 [Candidatus Dependentiae bacterium]